MRHQLFQNGHQTIKEDARKRRKCELIETLIKKLKNKIIHFNPSQKRGFHHIIYIFFGIFSKFIL
jgi:hypothetical protein